MKVIEKKTPTIFDVPSLRIESREFIEIVERYAVDQPEFKLTVGDYQSETQIIFDDPKELSEKPSLVYSPLNVTFGNIRLEIADRKCTIEFGEGDKTTATALKSDLDAHRSWLSIPFHAAFPAIISIAVFLLALPPFKISAAILSLVYFGIVFTLSVALTQMEWSVGRTRVVYQPRKTFIQRNADKIALIILGAVFGYLLGKIDLLLSIFSSGSQ